MKHRPTMILAVALVTIGLNGSPLAASIPMPPAPRDQVVVHDYAVTLGDLFLNAGDKAGLPVATAPAPGEREIFDPARLKSIADRHGLAWEPSGRSDRVLVARASREVGAERLQSLIASAMTARDSSWRFEVELDNRLQTIRLPTGTEDAISVEDLRVDTRNRRVSAMLAAPDGRQGIARQQVSGRLFEVVDIPVLGQPVMPGEVVTAADLDWTTVRTDRLRRGTVTDLRRIVGLTPRRPITPGAPIFQRDLEERIVVGKGAMVTIVYRTPNMTLSTVGRALDAGADGAAIRVVNTQSNRTVEAVVAGPDRVEIQPAGTLAFNQGYSR